MSTTLGGLWDGERHLLEPGEHFLTTGCTLVVLGYEELEEEDVLSPFESASQTPKLLDTGHVADPRFSQRETEQAWGSLSTILTSFAAIAEMPKKQYQENDVTNNTTVWSFTAEDNYSERI